MSKPNWLTMAEAKVNSQTRTRALQLRAKQKNYMADDFEVEAMTLQEAAPELEARCHAPD